MINKAVNFIKIEENTPEVIFEILLAAFSFEYIWEKYRQEIKDTTVIEEAGLIEIAKKISLETGFMEKYANKREKLNFICLLLYAVSYGQSCIESL